MLQELNTVVRAGEDSELPGKDSGDAFLSVCFCVVFIVTLYVSTAD